MTKTYTIIVTEDKEAADWDMEKFSAVDNLYRICGISSNKHKCINFVKGSLLHALAHSYSNDSIVPDKITIEFEVIEK